jgi:hypothetical protein
MFYNVSNQIQLVNFQPTLERLDGDAVIFESPPNFPSVK